MRMFIPRVSLLTFTLSVAHLSSAASIFAKDRTPIFKPGQTIAFEGDSHTSRSGDERHSWSYLRLNNWDQTWPNVVEDWYFCNKPQLELKFRNTGIGGSTVEELLARYDRTIAKIKPNWVFLTTTSNDSRRLTLEAYEQGLETYARKLRDDFKARIIIVDLYDKALWKADTEEDAKRQLFMTAARKILAKYDGLYVDVSKALAANATAIKKGWEGHTVMADGGHLNAVGAQMVGIQVLQAIGALTIH
jgi:lysophospholipase L1-like esterase